MAFPWLEEGLIGAVRDAAAGLETDLLLSGTGADHSHVQKGLIDLALSRLVENSDEMDLELSDASGGVPARIRLSPGQGVRGAGAFLMTFDAASTDLIDLDLPAWSRDPGASDLGTCAIVLSLAGEEEVRIALRALGRLTGLDQRGAEATLAAHDLEETLADDRSWLAAHLFRCCWSGPVSDFANLSSGITRAGLPALGALGLAEAHMTRHVVRDRSGAVVDVTYIFERMAPDPDTVWKGFDDTLGIRPASRGGDVGMALHLTWWIDRSDVVDGSRQGPQLGLPDRLVSAHPPNAAKVIYTPQNNVRVPDSPEHCVSGRMSLHVDLALPHAASTAILTHLSAGRIAEAHSAASDQMRMEVVLAPPSYDMPSQTGAAPRLAVAPAHGTPLSQLAGQGRGVRMLRHGTALVRTGAARYDDDDREWLPVAGSDADGAFSGWVASDDIRILPPNQAAEDGEGRVNPMLEWQGWRRHRISAGETLSAVAEAHGCTIRSLKDHNAKHLINPEILWPGDVLYVAPPPSQSA